MQGNSINDKKQKKAISNVGDRLNNIFPINDNYDFRSHGFRMYGLLHDDDHDDCK